MRLSDDKYLCPFCVSSWDCDGPHIKEEDLNNFLIRLHYIRRDLAELAKEEILSEREMNSKTLANSVYEKILNRIPS
jgi:hypothetical protein